MGDPTKRLTPLQGSEAAREGTATGFGGQRRRQKIDAIVDAGGGGSDSTPATPPAMRKPPPYTPSDTEKKTRTYGAPIQPPITRMREGQSTDSNNKY